MEPPKPGETKSGVDPADHVRKIMQGPDPDYPPKPPIPAQGKPAGNSGLTHSDNVPAGGDGVTQPKTAALP